MRRTRLIPYLPRGGGGLVGTVIITIGIGSLVVLALFLDRGSTYSEPIWQKLANNLPNPSYGVALIGRRPDVDLVAGTVTITWRPYACGGNLTVAAATGCDWPARPIDFYIDDAESPNFTFNPGKIGRWPEDPRLFYDAQNTRNFKYTHAIDAGTWDGHLSLQYHFPFDKLDVQTIFRAVDNLTSATLPFVRATLVETQTSFIKSFEDFTPLVLQANSSSPTVPVAVLHFTLIRSRSVKAVVMIIFLVNWGLTIMVLHITVFFIMENYKKDKKGVTEVPREILLLPVSVILTVPSLRAAMPNVPDFGIMLDIIGYFFNLIVVSICSMILILLLIYQGMPAQDKSPKSPDLDENTEVVVRPTQGIIIDA